MVELTNPVTLETVRVYEDAVPFFRGYERTSPQPAAPAKPVLSKES